MNQRDRTIGLLAVLLACNGRASPAADSADGGIGPLGTTGGSAGTGSQPTGFHDSDAPDPSAGETTDPLGTRFDVGESSFCQARTPGFYCTDKLATQCGENGTFVDSVDCNPGYCLPDVGCVTCLAGQYTCRAEKVMSCNDGASPPAWEVVEVCDPSIGAGCDAGLGACAILEPIGGTQPTGEYYQFANFTGSNSPFRGGYDVDGFDDRLYVLGFQRIDVYQVTLLDSDADGLLEPNQHPDNVNMPGPIEERTLTLLESLPTFGTAAAGSSELFVLADRMYIGGRALTEQVFNGATTQVTAPEPWMSGSLSHLGYDEVNKVWYGSNEGQRRVFQYDADTGTWGLAFRYPDLAGSHMDGLEVVTDPNTGTPYVYVSDMTSDFIGQYRLDPSAGWVQENLFSYAEATGSPVEGMGFGAFHHFWATSGSSLYEIGGGDLSAYTDPPQ